MWFALGNTFLASFVLMVALFNLIMGTKGIVTGERFGGSVASLAFGSILLTFFIVQMTVIILLITS